MCEALWSDPSPLKGRTPSKRGVGVQFGGCAGCAPCDPATRSECLTACDSPPLREGLVWVRAHSYCLVVGCRHRSSHPFRPGTVEVCMFGLAPGGAHSK